MIDQVSNESSQATFDEIALSLSGGGYRAAAFHLGTLKTLNALGLLARTRVLSTVSGGTITGAAWADSLAENISFDEFHQKLKSFLEETNVIEKSLANLSASVSINGFTAMPSLIRAAAQIYAAPDFLGGKTFGSLVGDRSVQLKEIVFNATDFRTGNAFRFQLSNSPHVSTGNNKSSVKQSVNEHIRLADIVAASSCFPSGFEPLRFPSDFVWGRGTAAELREIKGTLGERFENEIGLMDGGVFDNQGIDSIERIYERKNNEIGLYIVSDTDQRNAVLFESPIVPQSGRLTLAQATVLLWLLMTASLMTIIAIVVDAVQTSRTTGISLWRGIFLYFVPFLLAAGVAVFLARGRSLGRELLGKFNEETGIDVWRNFKNLSVRAVIEILASRAKSLVAMASSVFMKRIRDLGYNRIFASPDFQTKVIANIIYDLDNESWWGAEIKSAGLQPSDRLRQIAVRAEKYPTNLWFTNPDDLENLILCGEATMCFNVLKYLLRYRASEISDPNSAEAELYLTTLKHWQSLQ